MLRLPRQRCVRRMRRAAAEKGYLYPSVTAGVTGLRERRLFYKTGVPTGISSPFNLLNVGVNVSYTLDVFGGIRRQVEAANAQSEYQQFQLEATYLTLTADVVTAAIQEASLRGQIAATRSLINDERDHLGIVQNEFELGGASQADVAAQQTTLSQTEATLPPLNKQLQIEQDLLRLLTGHFPGDDVGTNFELSELLLPQNLPLSLPSQLVEQRPDIRQYQALLHVASAEVGVATANMLPQFTISGGLGTYAAEGVNPAVLAWSVAAGVTQPIFEGGTLTASQTRGNRSIQPGLGGVSLHGPGRIPERCGLPACNRNGRRRSEGRCNRRTLSVRELQART